MATCVVSGTVTDASGTALNAVPVTFSIQHAILAADPVVASTTSASDGTWSLTLTQGLSGIFHISVAPDNMSRRITYGFNANIPAAATATFYSTVVDQ